MTQTRKAPTRKAPTRKPKSRYSGIQASEAQDPYPNPGQYLLQVTRMVEGHNPGKGTDSVKISLEVVEADGGSAELPANPPGSRVFVSERVAGPGAPAGLARVKAFVMAAAGFEDEDEYDEFDPEGLFIEACLGEANEYAENDNLVVGRQVACAVGRGRETGDGDFYRTYSWEPVDQ